MFNDRHIPNFSRPFTFPKTMQGLFRFFWNSKTFQARPWIQGRCRNQQCSSMCIFNLSVTYNTLQACFDCMYRNYVNKAHQNGTTTPVQHACIGIMFVTVSDQQQISVVREISRPRWRRLRPLWWGINTGLRGVFLITIGSILYAFITTISLFVCMLGV